MSLNIKKTVIKQIKKMDLFSQPVQLFIKQESGHKTLFGAFLSTMIVSFFIYMFIINLRKMYYRTNPTSFMTEVFHQIPENFKYDSSNFTITFAFENPDFFTYIDESIYIAEASIYKKNVTIIDGKKESNWIVQDVPIIPCSDDLIRQEELKNYFQQLDLSTNYCIDWDKINEINLQGSFDTSEFSFLMIQFKMCNNSTKKQKECKSEEEIKKHLEKNIFSLQISSLVIDITQDNPFINKGEDIYTAVSSKLFKQTQIFLQPINIQTDVGMISETYESEKTLRYKRQTETIDLNSGEQILNLAIRLDQVEQQYYRNYSKFQQILSQMGGLWQVCFTIALLISKPINLISYYLRILNSLFSYEQEQNLPPSIQSNEEDDLRNSPRKLQFEKGMNLASEPMSPPYQEKAFLRLNSIQEKEKEFQLIEQISDRNHQEKEKKRLSNALSFSIKKYFHSISKKLTMTITDYLYFINCFVKSNKYKSLQIQYSVSKLYKQMDILYMMKKFQEIDRLKMIMLNESQIKLFDYLQKPVIPLDPTSKTFNLNQQYYSILKPIKSNYQRAQEAKQAFQEIIQNLENPINVKLLNSIDKQIISLLTMNQFKQDQFNLQEDYIDENEQIEINIPSINVNQKNKHQRIVIPSEWQGQSNNQTIK